MVVENLEFHVKRSGDSASRGMNNLSKSLKHVQNASRSVNKGLGSLMHTISRLAKVMVLRQVIRSVMKAFSEGLENVYKFNSMIGGEMAAALDSLKSASVQATGAIGSAFGELLATLSPILVSIMNLITRVANAIAQLFAVLGGRSTYTKAVASSEKWADATRAGAKAAKEWKNQLMGFDEINRLEEPSDSSGSGGGSSPYGGAFETAPAVNEWARQLREITSAWWKTVDLEPIINAWERLKEAVSGFVSIVNSGLRWAYENVLLPLAKWEIEKNYPAQINLLAANFEFLNTVLHKLAPYMKAFWEEIIIPMASFIGDIWVKAIEWLTKQFEGLTQKVESAKSLGEFLKSLSFGEALLLSLATAITAVAIAFDAWHSAISIVRTVGNVIGFLSSPVNIAIAAIAALILVGIALYQNWDEIKEQAGQLWDKVKETWNNIKQWISDKIDAINEKFEAFHKWVYDHITKPVEDMVDKVKEKFDHFKEKVVEVFEGTIIGQLLGFKKTADDTSLSVSNDMSAISDSIFNVYNNGSLLGQLGSAFENLAVRAHGALQDIITGLGHVINKCVEALQGLNAVANRRAAQNEADGSQYLTGFATGGFPDEGELFMAREGGMPEMVGRIGNRTAVANNDQIIQGISNGVYNAVLGAMSISHGNGNDTPIRIYLDGREIASTTTKYQRQFARAGTM